MKYFSLAKIKLLILANFPFALYLANYYFFKLPIYCLGLVINVIIFIMPGAGWLWLFRKRGFAGWVELLFCCILFSTCILISGIFLQALLPCEPTALFLFIFIMVITNIGILVSKEAYYPPWQLLTKKAALPILGFLFLYALFFWWAGRLIPPFEDNDLDIQCTSYGIMRTFSPFTLTDRLMVYEFSHPKLVDFYGASAILLGGKLADVKFYYDYGLTVKHRLGLEKIDTPLTWMDDKNAQLKAWITALKDEMYKKFNQNPNIIYTRMVHIFLGALGAVILFFLFNAIARSKMLSLLGVAVYVTLPENFIALCADRYTSLVNLFAISILYLYIAGGAKGLDKTPASRVMFWLNFFMALSYNKAVILPLSMFLCVCFIDKGPQKRGMANLALLGFIGGTLLTWAYGLIIDYKSFILDYFRYHLIHRLLYVNDKFGSGYYTFFGLWREFAGLHGIVFVTAATLSMFYLAWRRGTSKYILLVLWVLMGAGIFSIVDCRLTYHLLLIIPPLILGTFVFLNRLDEVAKTRFPALSILSIILARNIYILYRMWQDFYYIPTFKEW